MSKRIIHFAYATPYSLIDKITMRLLKRKLFHPPWYQCKWPVPLKAPLSITYQVAKRLSDEYEVKLYDLKEKLHLEPTGGDFFLGHLWHVKGTICYNALRNDKFIKKFIIGPYNHDTKQWSLKTGKALDDIAWAYDCIARCDRYIAICGDYWMDSFESSPFKDLREKFFHVNMALDFDQYPFLKNTYNKCGKRKFFYIGRYAHEKGTDLLEKLASNIPGFEGGYICMGGEIKGWKKISDPRPLTADFIRKIAEEYDFFINMSRADAQATTILEAASWGFPVACTRESGYSTDDFYYMDLTDFEKNREIVSQLQTIDEDSLRKAAVFTRRALAEKYNWQIFLDKLQRCLREG